MNKLINELMDKAYCIFTISRYRIISFANKGLLKNNLVISNFQ